MCPGKRQQVGVEADRTTAGMINALDHGALQVVVKQDSGYAAKGGEGQHMTTQEAVHPRVQTEAQKDAARVAQHHDEGHQRTLGATDDQMAEVSPVHLSLLARQRAQAQVGLCGWARLMSAWFYSDSINDLPLLSTVGHPIAVNPDDSLHHHALVNGWPVLDVLGKVAS